MVTRRDFLKTMTMASAGLAAGAGEILNAQTLSSSKNKNEKAQPEPPAVLFASCHFLVAFLREQRYNFLRKDLGAIRKSDPHDWRTML